MPSPPVDRPDGTDGGGAAARLPAAVALPGVLLLALNLRIVVGSLGVLLPQVRADLDMSTTVAGVLTTVPVLCFALFGFAANAVAGRIGLHRTAGLAMLALTAGLLLRPALGSAWPFVLVTALATAGAALGNVILPGLTRRHFPDRIRGVSALYGAFLVGGATLASATTVPLAGLLGGWRPGLRIWAVVSGAALVVWLLLSIRDRPAPGASRGTPLRTLARSRLAWTLALLFAVQSATAYAQFGWYPAILVDGGLDPGEAALMLAIVTGVSVPLTLALPALIRWSGDRVLLPIGFGVVTALGWLGVLLAPTILPWLSALLLGAGSTVFTWVLAVLGQRSRTTEGTVALSGFVQSIGYLIASVGPFGVGLLHELTGAWTVPLGVLLGLAVLIGVLGSLAARHRYVEDELVGAQWPT
ncbi:CP family cyanate transporter-like MFS transporter [Friedmanniella endophytica]|uniref:CP family cyanate transporter-like MFS transporter n=1 Tax=Microlunatus kandeliicorticis TaxID=1759536 RepID=A0A7W3IS17_9ACTN|nr:MFS transporter [Microlunatus kandeliicorticis]MBA8794165.1 CP family cyanate transporter-like MFS transporter [Microlunatus kandeliicorticis]